MRYLVGLAALAGALGLRQFLKSRPVRFEFDGTIYVRQPDGSFTSAEGAPVISPQLEAVKAHWETSKSWLRA